MISLSLEFKSSSLSGLRWAEDIMYDPCMVILLHKKPFWAFGRNCHIIQCIVMLDLAHNT